MIAPWHVILIVLTGIVFPWLKLPILIFIMRMYPFRDIIYKNIPTEVMPILRSVNDNYFYWNFGIFCCMSFFSKKSLDVQWFTFMSIIYSNIIYQIVLLSQWQRNPILACFITTTMQYLDGTPILFALIDNAASIYNPHASIIFIPQKLAFYVFCIVFDIIRKRI